jgi:hypothetical protein
VVALTAQRNAERLFEQCAEFRPDYAWIGDAGLHAALAERLRSAALGTQLLRGPEALERIATLPAADYVMAAIVGAAGLRSTLAAAGAGKRLLIANKEALVMAGRLVLAAAARSGATIIPIDSEHNAVFQCLPGAAVLGSAPPGVRRIMLTASGGPFRSWSASALQNVTPEQACAHPTWNMGRKISVDSATLMNKGLELIEPAGERYRSCNPSTERGAFAGGIHRRFGAGAAGFTGHAHTHSPGPGVAAALGVRCTILGFAAGRAARFRGPRSAALSVPGPGDGCGTGRRRNAGGAERGQ